MFQPPHRAGLQKSCEASRSGLGKLFDDRGAGSCGFFVFIFFLREAGVGFSVVCNDLVGIGA